MTDFTNGRWLLVALAVLGLVVAAPVVSAHGTEATDDPAPSNATAEDWAAWMAAHAAGHAGPHGEVWTDENASVDEMGPHAVHRNYGGGQYGSGTYGSGMYGGGTYGSGMYGGGTYGSGMYGGGTYGSGMYGGTYGRGHC